MGDRDLGPRGHRDDADPKTESNNVPGIMKIHNGDQEEDYRGNSAIPEADCGDANAGERGAGQVQMVVKFLVHKTLAGSVIGKGGARITEAQQQSGARIQMSKANVFYPGSLHYSQDRIILISGTVDQLLTALHIVLTRIRLEPRGDQETGKDDDRIELRLLVHSKLCGALIGKGGVTIKSFNEDNGARIHISPPPTHPGLNERVVKITGPIDEIMRAVALVVTKLSENPDFYLLSDSNLNYAYGTIYDMHPGTRAPRYLHNGSNSYSDIAPLWPSPSHPHANFHRIEITVPIPDDQVGQIIGKEGTTIKQIKNLVNVDIQISKRGDFLPGTSNRACQISGTPDAVNLAQQVILQRLNSS